MYLRYKQRLFARALLASLTLFLLAACSNGLPPTPTASEQTDFARVASVTIDPEQSQAEVEAIYGGAAFVFQPEAGFAILGFNEEQAALSTLATDPNKDAFSTPEVSVAGHGAWSGGHGAWSGGWDAWAGGWDAWAGGHGAWSGGFDAWAGGQNTVPTLPGDNRFVWSQSKLPQAHALARYFGDGIKVAVIDTGVDLNHPMLAGRLAPSHEWKDFVSNDNRPQEVSGSAYGHGTAVAGIILQIAPKATILPIRAMSADGSGDTDDIASAISWAVQKNADIINVSLGTDVDAAALKTVVDYATSRGIYVVASAGNEGNSAALTYPAAYAKTGSRAHYLVSVGSSAQNNDYLANFSNRGNALDVVAPGEQIYSAYPNRRIAAVTGTSFSAPQVAGALALAASNTATPQALESYLLKGTWSINGGWRHMSMVRLMLNLPDFKYGRHALFVAGSSSLNTADSAVVDRLRWSMGYNVTVKTAQSVSTADAYDKDIIIVSSTVASGQVNTKFRNVAVPLMTWEPYLFDDLGMVSAASGNYGNAGNQREVRLTTVPHPLVAGLQARTSSNTRAFYSAPASMSWGKPAPSAMKIATLTSNSSKAVIFSYEKGDQMVGMQAPARRLAFASNDNNKVSYWTNKWLFEAAVTWLATGN